MCVDDVGPGLGPAEIAVEQPPDAKAPANVRAILRVGNEFFLRSIDGMVAAQNGDLIAALIFNTLWIANVRHITHSAANTQFRGLDDMPPDALRRPVSVQALANTLRIPYETVRRYVQTMIRKGDCIRVGKRGLIVPAAVHSQPHRRESLRAGLPSLMRFLDDLKLAGFDFSPYRRTLANTVPASGKTPANARALMRAGMDLIMHGVDSIGRLHGNDFLAGMICTTIWTANLRHITCSRDNLKYGGLDQLPPDDARRPVKVNAIAAALQLPYETTRRSVSKLVRAGVVVRIEGRGVIFPRAQFARPDYYEAARQSYAQIVHTVSDLHRAGFDFRKY